MTTDKTTEEFAYACSVLNSIAELEQAIKDGPDKFDLEYWGLTEDEWLEGIKLAIAKLTAEEWLEGVKLAIAKLQQD